MAETRLFPLLFGPGLGMRLGHTLRVLHFARYCANNHLLHEAQHFMEEGGREGWMGGWLKRVGRRTNRWMDEQTEEWMKRLNNGRTDEWNNENKDEQTEG